MPLKNWRLACLLSAVGGCAANPFAAPPPGGSAAMTPAPSKSLDPSDTMAHLQRVADDDARLGRPEDEAGQLLELVKYANAQGNYKQQRVWLTAAAAVVPEASAQSAQTRALLAEITQQQGVELQARGQLSAALQTAQRADQMAGLTGNARLQAAAQRSIASVYEEMGQSSLALAAAEKAYATAQSAKEQQELSRALELRAVLDYDAGKYADSLQDAQASKAQLTAGDWFDEVARARLFAVRCAISLRLGDLSGAAKSCDTAMADAVSTKAGGVQAVVSNNRAVLKSLGTATPANTKQILASSDQEYRQAIKIYQNLGDPLLEAITWNNVGDLYDRFGRQPDALAYLRKALAIEIQIGVLPRQSDTLLRIGQLCLREGDLKCANNSLRAALAVQLRMGTVAAHSDLPGAQTGQPESLWRIFTALAALEAAQNHDDAAIFWGKMAVDTIQGMRASLTPIGRDLQRSFLSEKRVVYTRLATLLVKHGQIVQNEQVMDMLKDEEFFEFTNRDATHTSSDTLTLSTQESSEQAGLASMSNQLSVETAAEYADSRGDTDPDKPLSKAAQAALQAKIDQQAALVDSFVAQVEQASAAPSAAAASSHTEVKQDLSNLRILLHSLRPTQPAAAGTHQVASLQYIVGEHQLSVILTSSLDQSWVHAVTVDAATVWSKIEAYRRVVMDHNSEPTKTPEGRDLYDLLIGTWGRQLLTQQSIDTLVLDLDGPLRYLPFGALFDGQKYLIESFRIVRYGRNVQVDLKDLLGARNQLKIAAFGVTKAHAPDFPALYGVRSEIDGIVPMFTCCPAVFDEDFTRLELISLTSKAPLLHIATHFDLMGNVNDSFLLLGNGDHLTLSAMDGIPLDDVALLTLSACNTAMGDDSKKGGGEELDGLWGKAQEQGAKAVLATLWSVEDDSTAILMREFYKFLLQANEDKVGALQAAQLELLHGSIDMSAPAAVTAAGVAARSGVPVSAAPMAAPASNSKDRFVHPYYWAPFVLMGNWL
jgi:CHAT domain-containing protein